MAKKGFTPLEMSKTLTRKAKSLTGFTLIEVTIALLVLAIGLLGILSLFPVGFDASRKAGDVTIATFLAQGKLEDAKVKGYADVGDMDTSGSRVTFATPYAKFQYKITVTLDAGSLGLDLKQVDVEIFWPEGIAEENQQNIALTIYMAKYEP